MQKINIIKIFIIALVLFNLFHQKCNAKDNIKDTNLTEDSLNDVELFNKLKKEISKKEQNNKLHSGGDIKVIIKNPQDTNLTKKVKTLLNKNHVKNTTKKYEKILKKQN